MTTTNDERDRNRPQRPAFPANPQTQCNGMTLREWYAGLAMQGLLARNDGVIQEPGATAKQNVELTVRAVTTLAVQCADALLAELAKERP